MHLLAKTRLFVASGAASFYSISTALLQKQSLHIKSSARFSRYAASPAGHLTAHTWSGAAYEHDPQLHACGAQPLACSRPALLPRAGRQRSQGPASRPRQRWAHTTAAQGRGAGAVTRKHSSALAHKPRRRACLPLPPEPPGGPRPARRSAPGRRLVIHIQARAARVAARHRRGAAAAEVRRRLVLLGRCQPTALPSLRSWAIRTGQRPAPLYSLVRQRSQAACASSTPSLACCSLASPGARNNCGHTRSTGACRRYGRSSGGSCTKWGRDARQRRRYQQPEPHQGRRSASKPTRERCGPRHPCSHASRGPPLAGKLSGRPLEPGSHHIPGAAAPAWLCSASRLLCVHSAIHRRAPTEGCTRFHGLAAHAAGLGLAAGCGSTANTANSAFCT
jgi:hypothetical protein